MVLNRLSLKLFIVAALAVFIFLAFALRVFLPYENIFVGDWIKFSSIDAYFHMRMIDHMAASFPQAMTFDPYLIYPDGAGLSGTRFFDWLLVGIIWVVSFGSPSQHTIDIVGVYYPVILAALTVIPVYFIGKNLFNHWAGLIGALLIAVFPGEYIGRSILGFTDYHAAETLFTTTAVLFLILAVKEGVQRGLSLSSFTGENRKAVIRPLVYAVLTGLCLGLYLITWAGGLLFVFIFSLYFIVQFITDHLRGKPTQHLGITGCLLFLVALLIFLAVSPGSIKYTALIVALLLPPVLAAVASLMARRGLKAWYYPLGVVVLGAAFIGIFYAVSPGLVGSMVGAFKIFAPMGSSAATTLEMQPFLSPEGSFSTLVAWGNYTTSFFIFSPWWLLLSLVLMGVVGYLIRKLTNSTGWAVCAFLLLSAIIITSTVLSLLTKNEFVGGMAYWTLPGFAFIALFILVSVYTRQPGHAGNLAGRIIALVLLAVSLGLLNFSFVPALVALGLFLVTYIWLSSRREEDNQGFLFFLVWTLIILVLTLVQRRFAYYLVVNIALLSAYVSWQIIWYGGLKGWLALRREPEPEAAGKHSAKARKRLPARESVTPYVLNTLLAGILVFVFIVYPNIGKARDVASQTLFAPSDAWQSSLLWLKDNTPPPFGDEDAYYQFYEPPAPGEKFAYPESAYGVTSWWDYGYWITRIGHRLPNTNPSQKKEPIIKTANLLLADDSGDITALADEMNSAYMITDYAMTVSKFWAIVEWSGRPHSDFIQTYYVLYENSLVPINTFKPEYYHTLAVRLHNFDGLAVAEGHPVVISYAKETSDRGETIFVIESIDDINEFESYQEAQDYIDSQPSGNHDIVGINPFITPVPLEEVAEYRLVHSSEQGSFTESVGVVPEVKIFEYTGG